MWGKGLLFFRLLRMGDLGRFFGYILVLFGLFCFAWRRRVGGAVISGLGLDIFLGLRVSVYLSCLRLLVPTQISSELKHGSDLLRLEGLSLWVGDLVAGCLYNLSGWNHSINSKSPLPLKHNNYRRTRHPPTPTPLAPIAQSATVSLLLKARLTRPLDGCIPCS
ncbi:hypothetical protein N657DRAFT_109030 [Parathielavia appendiculata]|uniref:Uncharacterized protein n=1 Tax=Parathielavia appendiculata TaxID=2587402 RepID=A0AAN6TWR6_9PEZI|nr:hypothetical protein N657DRAFT_109030 [Parathielavia appendiculata]